LGPVATIPAKGGCKVALRIMFVARNLFLLLLCPATVLAQGTSPFSPTQEIARADELLRAGKPKDALAILNHLKELAPNTPHLEARIGKSYFQSSQFQPAIEPLKLALQQDESDGESLQLLALSYFVLARYADALPLLEKLGPRLSNVGPDGPYLLANCYVMVQRWEDARKTYAKLLSLDPDSPSAHLMFGKFLVRQRLENRAVPEIQTALQRDPQLAMAHFMLGEIDLYKGDVPGAIDEFHKELEVNPAVWLAYWRLGEAYMRVEKYDDAERVLKRAVWLNETSSGPYILLGQMALKRENPQAAAGYLETAVRLDAQNDYVHYFLGKAYQALGRTAEANRHFDIAKQLRNNRRVGEQANSQMLREPAQ
jgi:tetratricopeptide (TPR) repeat protein